MSLFQKVIGVLLVGGGLAAWQFGYLGVLPGFGRPDSDSRRPEQRELALRYAFEGRDEGQLPANHVFRNGDRFRILLRPGSGAPFAYVFYEDRANHRMRLLYPEGGWPAAELEDRAAVPAGENRWIEMDNHSGVEHFVLLASARPLTGLPLDSDTCSSSEFASALARIRKGPGLKEGKTTRDSGWAESKARSSGALMVKVDVEHQ